MHRCMLSIVSCKRPKNEEGRTRKNTTALTWKIQFANMDKYFLDKLDESNTALLEFEC